MIDSLMASFYRISGIPVNLIPFSNITIEFFNESVSPETVAFFFSVPGSVLDKSTVHISLCEKEQNRDAVLK